jgi:hypothetical protein
MHGGGSCSGETARHNSVWLGGIELMSPWSADLDLDQFEYRRRNAC